MNKWSFAGLLPAPRYLEFPSVGIDFSDNSVKFIELIRDPSLVSVGRYGRKPFSGGVMDSVSTDKDLTKVLSEIKSENSFNLVSVSIPEEESYFVRIRLPLIKVEGIREAIELQIEEHIPHKATDLEFDYEILSAVQGNGGYIDVNVVALPKVAVGRYLEIFNNANLWPASFVVEADATSKAVIGGSLKEVLMVVNIGKINTVLSIVVDGSVWFSYTFKFGGDVITKNLEKGLSLTNDEAERVKCEQGINPDASQKVFECLMPSIAAIRDEISKHLDYWNAHKGDLSPGGDETRNMETIILCGSQAVIPGIADYLTNSLGVNTILANPWVNIIDFENYIPPINKREVLEYATAIGAAMGDSKR